MNLRQLNRIRRFISNIITNNTLPPRLRQKAREISSTLRFTPAEITALIDIIEDEEATLPDRIDALERLGQILRRGLVGGN